MSSTPQDRSARQAKIAAAAPKESKLKPILGVLVALLAVAGIAWAIMAGMNQSSTEAGGALPRGAVSETGGIMLNPTEPAAGTPVLDIYEDFQCPWCARFHEVLGPTVDELATSGEAKVVIHMKTFLDNGFPGEHSMKAANAAACASDAGPEAFMKVRDGIMSSQPEKEGDGWPDETFSQLAEQSGITGDAKKTFDRCVGDVKYRDYLKKVDEQSARDGVTGTPTYKIDGTDFDLSKAMDPNTGAQNPEALVEAVRAAKK